MLSVALSLSSNDSEDDEKASSSVSYDYWIDCMSAEQAKERW